MKFDAVMELAKKAERIVTDEAGKQDTTGLTALLNQMFESKAISHALPFNADGYKWTDKDLEVVRATLQTEVDEGVLPF